MTRAALARARSRRDPARSRRPHTGKLPAKIHALARRIDARLGAGETRGRLHELAMALKHLLDEARLRGIAVDPAVERTLASAWALRSVASRPRGHAEDPRRPRRDPARARPSRVVVTPGTATTPWRAEVFDTEGSIRSRVEGYATGKAHTDFPHGHTEREYVEHWIATYFPGLPVERRDPARASRRPSRRRP